MRTLAAIIFFPVGVLLALLALDIGRDVLACWDCIGAETKKIGAGLAAASIGAFMIGSGKPRTVMMLVTASVVYPVAALATWVGFDMSKAIVRCWECFGSQEKVLAASFLVGSAVAVLWMTVALIDLGSRPERVED
ncbi:hypothetical protein JL100_018110 [Skermanella mucosa]|uniref:hypothetical protein n=1 Tax=Skermanella mucosa TaxID=1789672 RepID=UPI00192BD479|nr:hypothetical protein [Skermanella mucosa]UEM19001.1 hypothetical protein JL100_018110 [Skermanella mucosa]